MTAIDLDRILFEEECNDDYDKISAEEINQRIAAECAFGEVPRYWATDVGLAAKLLEYEMHIFLIPHIKGGWMAVNTSRYYKGSIRRIRCQTLARTMCAAFLEWVHLGRKTT